jgi:predicted lipoprotein with Yx(FWY)xxD motif
VGPEVVGDFDVAVGETDLGEVLVDAEGMTLYVYSEDEDGVSNCDDTCAAGWPPLEPTEPAEPAADTNVTGELSVITRDDGSSQLAINGHPLYLFAGDAEAGDVNGNGMGGVWSAVTPAGEPLAADSSAGGDATTTTESSGGMDY